MVIRMRMSLNRLTPSPLRGEGGVRGGHSYRVIVPTGAPTPHPASRSSATLSPKGRGILDDHPSLPPPIIRLHSPMAIVTPPDTCPWPDPRLRLLNNDLHSRYFQP